MNDIELITHLKKLVGDDVSKVLMDGGIKLNVNETVYSIDDVNILFTKDINDDIDRILLLFEVLINNYYRLYELYPIVRKLLAVIQGHIRHLYKCTSIDIDDRLYTYNNLMCNMLDELYNGLGFRFECVESYDFTLSKLSNILYSLYNILNISLSKCDYSSSSSLEYLVCTVLYGTLQYVTCSLLIYLTIDDNIPEDDIKGDYKPITIAKNSLDKFNDVNLDELICPTVSNTTTNCKNLTVQGNIRDGNTQSETSLLYLNEVSNSIAMQSSRTNNLQSNSTHDVQSNSLRPADNSPLEVTTTVPLGSTVGLADSSPNYLSLKSKATPGDRGSVYPEEQKMSTRKNRPQVEPGSDLRELEGEVNRIGHHGEWNEDKVVTSGVTPSIEYDKSMMSTQSSRGDVTPSTLSSNPSLLSTCILIMDIMYKCDLIDDILWCKHIIIPMLDVLYYGLYIKGNLLIKKRYIMDTIITCSINIFNSNNINNCCSLLIRYINEILLITSSILVKINNNIKTVLIIQYNIVQNTTKLTPLKYNKPNIKDINNTNKINNRDINSYIHLNELKLYLDEFYKDYEYIYKCSFNYLSSLIDDPIEYIEIKDDNKLINIIEDIDLIQILCQVIIKITTFIQLSDSFIYITKRNPNFDIVIQLKQIVEQSFLFLKLYIKNYHLD